MKDQGYSIRRTITISSLALSLGLLSVFTIIWISLEIKRSNRSIQEHKENLYQQQKLDLKIRVNNLLSLIEAQRNTTDRSEKEIQDEILDWVATIRFEYGGYYFINQTDGKALVYDGMRVIEDRNLKNMTDPNGLRLFDLELEAFKDPSGRFMHYLFKRIDTETPEQKVSFMRGIQDWHWIVGAGNYVRDVSKQLDLLKYENKQDLKRNIIFILIVFVGICIILFFVAKFLAYKINKHLEQMERMVEYLVDGDDDMAPAQQKLFFKEQNNFIEKFKQLIGQKVQAEKDQKNALLIAERNAKLKAAFLNNLSHEIRTPLNSMVGFSNLLLDDDIDLETKMDYLNIINRSSDNLLNMLNEILYVARSESDDEVRLDYSWFNISHLLQEVFELFIPDCIEKKLELRIQSNPNFPDLIVYSDRSKVLQVLNSLVSNAMKFTHQGHVALGYQVSDNQCIFQVEDTGIGLTEEDTELIFDSFYQADSSLSKKFTGIGLGLNMAKKIVHILDGEIWVESKLNKGSIFYFSIPLNQENQNDKN